MRAAVLLSGGLDSTVLATLAAKLFGKDNVHPITFRYGQRHEDRELEAALEVCRYLGLPSYIVDVPNALLYDPGSALTGSLEMPHASYEELREQAGTSPTYVPYRNGVLLSMAAALAYKWDCDRVCYAAHADDGFNYAYPDCTPEFAMAQGEAIEVGTAFKVKLWAPFIELTKAEIVKAGSGLEAPLHLTYSCYEGRQRHCGICPTCVNRKEAFMQAGVKDITEYEDPKCWGLGAPPQQGGLCE